MNSVNQRVLDFNTGRDPVFLALKYEAMSENPFRFFRGSCHLFYEDFSKNIPFHDPTKVWICGDLHLENFGSYKAGNGLVYFDLGDFDESIQAPVTWEIVRTMTSIYLAVNQLKLPVKMADKLVKGFFEVYNEIILTGKPIVFERSTATGLMKKFITTVAKRRSRDLLSERTNIADGGHSIKIIHDRTTKMEPALKKDLKNAMAVWCKKHHCKNWKIRDAVHRIAGTGSLGLPRYVLLVHDNEQDKYFLLDMKKSVQGSLSPYVKIKQPVWKNEAKRVVTIQNYMQNVLPANLSTISFGGEMFVLKKLQPQSDRMNLKVCKGKIEKLKEIIEAFAGMTASAHLRSTGRLGSSTVDDLIAFFETSETWQKSLINYSKNYAEQVKRDYNAFCDGA
jgi:uncharacterized protein (DUF2252 family)